MPGAGAGRTRTHGAGSAQGRRPALDVRLRRLRHPVVAPRLTAPGDLVPGRRDQPAQGRCATPHRNACRACRKKPRPHALSRPHLRPARRHPAHRPRCGHELHAAEAAHSATAWAAWTRTRPRAKVAALQKQITETGLAFAKNIRDDKGDVPFKPADLAGVPQDFLDAHKPGCRWL